MGALNLPQLIYTKLPVDLDVSIRCFDKHVPSLEIRPNDNVTINSLKKTFIVSEATSPDLGITTNCFKLANLRYQLGIFHVHTLDVSISFHIKVEVLRNVSVYLEFTLRIMWYLLDPQYLLIKFPTFHFLYLKLRRLLSHVYVLTLLCKYEVPFISF